MRGKLIACNLRACAIAVFLLVVTACKSRNQFPPSGAGPTAQPDCFNLAVPLVGQMEPNWCWNATGQMAMNFLGANPAVEQKKSVKFNAGNEDCFYKGTNCDMTGWPILFQHGFDFRKTMNEALSLDDLKDQIYTKKKPVAVSWHYMGGKGHMALAFGYCLINGKYSIDFNDPDFSGQDYKNPTGQYYQLPYDFYLTGNYKNNHWNDFYDITNTQ